MRARHDQTRYQFGQGGVLIAQRDQEGLVTAILLSFSKPGCRRALIHVCHFEHIYLAIYKDIIYLWVESK